MNSYYTLKQPSFLCSSNVGIYLIFIYFDTNRALQSNQYTVNSFEILSYTFKAFNKGLTKAYCKYGKIHLYFNISEFSDNLFSTRNGCCSDFSTKQDVCKLYVVSEWLLSVSVFCFALSPVPSYFFR